MHRGLRFKSALALCLSMALVLLLAVTAGWRAVRAVEENLGAAYARNITRYHKQRILTPVLRELALSQRLADSEVTRRWLLDERDPAKKELFFAEAERYRRAFADGSYFVASGPSRGYYFNDGRAPHSDRPRYTLQPSDPDEAWFFSTLKNTKAYNLNVDQNPKIKRTNVWINVLVRDRGRTLGVVGSGLDLTRFLDRFIAHGEAGVTPLILGPNGSIQAHPDRRLIDYSTVSDKGADRSTVYKLLSNDGDRRRMRDALHHATGDDDRIQIFHADLNGVPRLCAVSYIPELNWDVVTAVDLKAARVIDPRVWLPLLAVGGLLVLLLVGAITFAVDRLLLAPLLKLTESVRGMTGGNYAVALPRAGGDELGELTRAFGDMAAQVRSHTEDLEGKVRERTHALAAVNEEMAAAHRKIGDSIRYASLIQNALLPDGDLSRALSDRHFVLWRPRDVVGGDFYVFRATERGCLIGVVDCAGHGVPGAFMTMIAHTLLNTAIDHLGPADPARLLGFVDARLREMLDAGSADSGIVTNMDAGLAYADFGAGTLTFSGAKVSLYGCDGGRVSEVRGSRRTIGHKRVPAFANATLPLDPRVTFYLTTDGLPDQAGGDKGYGFGHDRLAGLLLRASGLPFAEQRDAFEAALAEYQGGLPQRDDITVLGFRFSPSPEAAPFQELNPTEELV